jgi:hypothetical protein
MYDRRAHNIEKAILQVAHEVRELHEWFEKYFGSSGAKGTRFDVSVGPVKQKKESQTDMITIALTNLQICTVTLSPKNRKGKPAPIDGVPVWTLQSGNCTIEPSADGKSCVITTPDELADDPAANVTTLLAEGDADIGAGFVPLDETFVITVSAEPATTLGAVVSAPVDKPDAPAMRAAALAKVDKTPKAKSEAKGKKR